ncbi:MAG TPA: hypothetical protein DCZ94_07275 [Lentisphaeria bacterium]|nr:MAG: hypothetical protein A2X48_20425 [Lentisphaerae bacterium GWF2_49_21]HBC86737.1 hypothetical protein [Lentisphaeria bacterium]
MVNNTQITPKQKAFLDYVGIPSADKLSKSEAGEMINQIRNTILDIAEDENHLEAMKARIEDWNLKKLVLHPELYQYELKYFLDHDLPEKLHTYIRNNIKGSSEKLTKDKIKKAINILSKRDYSWWQGDNINENFRIELQLVYPKCCDGAPVEKKAYLRKANNAIVRPDFKSASKTGCVIPLALISFLFSIMSILIINLLR